MPVVVALAALLAYAGTLAHGFVWDDPILIRDRILLYTWSDLPRLLGADFFAFTAQPSHYYRPFITLTFFLDLALWGLHPFGFHLTNILAHALVSVCVFWLARRVTGRDAAAVLAGLLFALHPVHSESVAFISGRTDVFAALFLLAALLAYARHRDSGRPGWIALSLGAFALALLSKEAAVVLPALLALYDWWIRRDLRDRRSALGGLLRYAPYAGVLGGYLVSRRLALGHMVTTPDIPWADVTSRLLTTVKMMGWYARAVLVPFPDTLLYVVPPDTVSPEPLWWLTAAWLLGLLALTATAALRWPAAAFAGLWFWVALVPPVGVNLLPVSEAIMADRFLYIPSVGVCLLMALLLARFLGEIQWSGTAQLRPVPAAAGALLLVAFAMGTLWRNEAWKDEFRLNTRIVETSPGSALGHHNLGLTYLREGNLTLSLAHLRKARELHGKEKAYVLAAIGFVETLLGNRDTGLELALRAHAREPGNPAVLGVLADIHRERGETAQALAVLDRALASNPLSAQEVAGHLNRAMLLVDLDRLDEAEAALERGRALNAAVKVESSYIDRVAAEIAMARRPAEAQAAWARYVESLRAIRNPTPRHQADLASAEQRLAALSGPIAR